MEHLHLFTSVEEGLPENDFGKVYLIIVGGDEIPSYFDKNNNVFVNLAMTRNLNATHWLDLSKLTTKKKLDIAIDALANIMNWDDDLEDEWGDPGYRAKEALKEIGL